ncbi:hypothetical protein CN198_08100 [Sinorhizobium meliloti]|nr:hypothetical protein CN240_17460 [Sinorhizobium meliloti]RVG43282.1 hypothetical protein CN227_21455 [Sinorhizobium meliloti]RVH71970.1 hypothetical protein CN198_08100 [Sinorhizobium meliloti]RVK67260.1 hypothetical protein CN159_16015 [Sinorhizobium meliloti]RVO95312.1 hypothetical protein CN089_12025 [Sinorhizobium meliloti]
MRGSVGAACPFSPPAGRRCRQADEGRVTANANVSAYGFDPKDPSASLATVEMQMPPLRSKSAKGWTTRDMCMP